ncbi:lytic polysaccharide monooxygenase [Erwinia tracheiphila]|nr:lytic polysaccharide monooxygenase [Erwinia tracheiphila]EOS94325.1 chitin binding domain-containing protein [Erwinia tracheiphila PSU-1]UIA82495.1 lytic polysaccharide monooxygenase [Erwinia tracheiphila]UIA89253.1 lytic polysaccharide monooxygenase [Erwinia tracheiphila]UIA91085.1 lytic polysaccharide monooxygenase [Erwinia tracheiphila]UIA97636.1 lytic polysaccharide monooxygenase [Erwinia tracheiphila]
MKPRLKYPEWKASGFLLSGMMISFFSLWLPVKQAEAHGAVGYPIARQYQCFVEGGFWGNPANIRSADCRQAILNGGANPQWPFQQWNELSANPTNPGDFETVKRAVPDGLLCAGGDPRKRGLDDTPTTLWRKTKITPDNGYFQLRWDNTQAHNPSRMYIYITKPGYNPTQPLHWDDLEKIYDQQSPAPVPANNTGHVAGTVGTFYLLNVKIPEGRTGDAIIYSWWQREDAGNEGFFNCSDVTIEPEQGVSFPWKDGGRYYTPDLRPAPGDSVQFRVMGGNTQGLEAVNVRLPITSHNQASNVWTNELANVLNAQYASLVRVGVRNGNQIGYLATDFAANKIWLLKGYSSALDIIPGSPAPDPTPEAAPIARITAPASVQASTMASFSASQSTGQHISYKWAFRHFVPASSIGESVSVKAEDSTTELIGSVSLTVTDSHGRQATSEKTVRIIPQPSPGQYPQWSRADVSSYHAGTIVTGLDGHAWVCKPFPYSQWCSQSVPTSWTDQNWAYAPGSHAANALAEENRAWTALLH